MGFSMSHLLLIALILGVIFFKPGNVSGLGRSIGKAIRNFKEALNEIEVDEKDIREISSTKQETEKNSEKAKDKSNQT